LAPLKSFGSRLRYGEQKNPESDPIRRLQENGGPTDARISGRHEFRVAVPTLQAWHRQGVLRMPQAVAPEANGATSRQRGDDAYMDPLYLLVTRSIVPSVRDRPSRTRHARCSHAVEPCPMAFAALAEAEAMHQAVRLLASLFPSLWRRGRRQPKAVRVTPDPRVAFEIDPAPPAAPESFDLRDGLVESRSGRSRSGQTECSPIWEHEYDAPYRHLGDGHGDHHW
jgi:hypothetical protein